MKILKLDILYLKKNFTMIIIKFFIIISQGLANIELLLANSKSYNIVVDLKL